MAASAFTDQSRICTIHSVLGPNVLLLQRMEGRERISEPFRFELDFYSEKSDVQFDEIVGTSLTLELQLPDQKKRYWNGVVSRFSQGKRDGRFVAYRAELVPSLWYLTRTTDCRIFQEQTLPDIIGEVFKDYGLSEYRFELNGEHPVWEYCVQYRETAFNFVSRLMEQEGIFYHFEHEASRHTMVLGDSSSVHQPCPDQADADYATDAAARRAGEVESWRYERELPPGKVALKDYNFKLPKDDLLSERKTVDAIGKKFGYEVFDYPGEYASKGEGSGLAGLRLEAEESASHEIHATSDLGAFSAGYRFHLRNHYRKDFNEEYVLTEVQHSIEAGPGYGEGASAYENRFVCIPCSVPFRPLRRTPKPIVQGPQTAVVVGPAGEEIYSDSYGRVKVQFFWDRRGKFDENSSCWIRVSQGWAGKIWGGIALPRIGQEVIVEFIEGDPDRPIITGRVYNGELMPPYELPRHQTMSTFKSRSTKAGAADNYNEIRFEDEKGKEQLFVHAEMDMDHRVKQDYRSIVRRDRDGIVERDQRCRIDGNENAQVGGSRLEKIGGSVHLQVGGDRHETIGNIYANDTGTEISLKAGMKVVIEAGAQLHLKVGGNHIDIGPGGIVIQGTMVRINSGPSPATGTPARPDEPEKPHVADDGTKRTMLS